MGKVFIQIDTLATNHHHRKNPNNRMVGTLDVLRWKELIGWKFKVVTSHC